jgi:hypothetical protein
MLPLMPSSARRNVRTAGAPLSRIAFAVLHVALGLGFCIDAFVGILCLFAQPLLLPLLDLPVKDPAVTTIAGGELLVAAGIYAFVLSDTVRWRPLLWLCALDQAFGALLPAIEIARGHAPATWKTLGPVPLQLILCGIFIASARWAARPDEAVSRAGTGDQR